MPEPKGPRPVRPPAPALPEEDESIDELPTDEIPRTTPDSATLLPDDISGEDGDADLEETPLPASARAKGTFVPDDAPPLRRDLRVPPPSRPVTSATPSLPPAASKPTAPTTFMPEDEPAPTRRKR